MWVWSTEDRRTLMGRKTSEQLWHLRGSSSSLIAVTGECVLDTVYSGLIFNFTCLIVRHMADRLGTPYLQKVLNQVSAYHNHSICCVLYSVTCITCTCTYILFILYTLYMSIMSFVIAFV